MSGAGERYRVVYRKLGPARFLSHLDLMATLEYAVRRSRLPVALSEGFNPRPRLSGAAPLPVGYLGEHEILEIELRESCSPEAVQEQLQAALPAGIEIRRVEPLPPGSRPAAARLRAATYHVCWPHPVTDITDRVASVLAAARLEVSERHKDTTRRRDIRPCLLSIEDFDVQSLRVTVSLTPDGGTARPEQILALMGIPSDGAVITRESIEISP